MTMALEDHDMHDAIVVDSGEDDDFYAGGNSDSTVDGEGDGDYAFDSEPESDDRFPGNHCVPDSQGRQKNYALLKREDIHRRQEDDVTEVSTVLSIPRESSRLLLRHYNWSVNTVHEEWFADEERVRKTVGLLENTIVQFSPAKKLTCGICFDEYSSQMISTAACGHPFCKECWQGYITTSIVDGPGCLLLRCPEPSCRAAVDKDMIDDLVSDDEYRKRYYGFLIRSYVEDNRKIKWCPAPGCDCAVQFVLGSGSYDVTCGCSYKFCWNCAEDSHRPVDCDTVAKWMLKKNAEAENTNWIFAFTKPCPKCQKPIEKNSGCMHMTCRAPCRHEFCWLCLCPWNDHGYAPCNRYKNREFDEEEKKREKKQEYLKRYTHYYERWATNQSSREKAIGDLQKMENVKLVKLSKIQGQPETQLKFILDAWVQIIECRRVLKWTYAYGYYLPENEKTKKAFFEYLQGQAEARLERLHQCAENELEIFSEEEMPSDEFIKYRVKLTGLTTVTKNYFENLVRALEKGLADVSENGVDRPCSEETDASKTGRLGIDSGYAQEYVAYDVSNGGYYDLSD